MSSKVMVQSDGPKLRSGNRPYGRHLVTRGCTLYFRFVVPLLLRSVLGYTEIRRTMGGASIRCARAVAAIIGSRLRLVFDDAMREAKRGYGVDKDKLTDLVHSILDEEFDRLSKEVMHEATIRGGLTKEDVAELKGRYGQIALECATKPFETEILVFGQELIVEAIDYASNKSAQMILGLLQGLDDVGITELEQAIIKARCVAYTAAAHDEQLLPATRGRAHEELNDFFPLPAPSPSIPAQQSMQEPSQTAISQLSPSISSHNIQNTNLSEAVEQIAKSLNLQMLKAIPVGKAVTLFLDSQRTDKKRSLKNKELALKEFALAMGAERLTTEIDVELIERYANLLSCLPNRRGKQVLRDDIWSYIDNPGEGKRLDGGSVKSKLSHVKTLLNDMRRRNFISSDLLSASCFVINETIKPIDLGKSREVKPPFELGHLETLFDPDKFLPWTSLRGDDFWLPLMGLFTGARLDEIVRLQRRDIKQTPEVPVWSKKKDNSRHGIWYMDITAKEKRLKTNASHRVIPLHPYLINIGLIEYVNDFEQDDLIFPHYGTMEYTKASDMFRDYRRAVGVGRQENEDTGEDLVFHTFRHTLADTFKENFVPDSVSYEIMGHSPGKDVHTDSYDKNHSIEALFDNGTVVLDYYVDNVEALRKIAALAKTNKAPWTLAKKDRPVYRIKGKRRSFKYPYTIDGMQ